jgi:hypothetical protein
LSSEPNPRTRVGPAARVAFEVAVVQCSYFLVLVDEPVCRPEAL